MDAPIDNDLFVVEVYNGRRWAKVRGCEGGPFLTFGRAARVADARANAPRRPSSTEGLPHRVREVAASGRHTIGRVAS